MSDGYLPIAFAALAKKEKGKKIFSIYVRFFALFLPFWLSLSEIFFLQQSVLPVYKILPFRPPPSEALPSLFLYTSLLPFIFSLDFLFPLCASISIDGLATSFSFSFVTQHRSTT